MRKEMYISCDRTNNADFINFYITTGTEKYFLFTQRYRLCLYDFYKNGVPVRKMYDYKTAHRNPVIVNVIDRLPAQITYAEKAYDITILHKTGKEKRRKTVHCA